jgi:hypothetical protein
MTTAGPDQYQFVIGDRSGQILPTNARTAHLMISIRNRAFNKRLIDAFCDFAVARCAGGVITVVDAPYIHNIHAQTSPGPERDRKVAMLMQLSTERTRHAQKRLSNNGHGNLRIVTWAALARLTPDWMCAEIQQAFAQGGPFAGAINQHVLQVIDGFAEATMNDSFVGFLLEELPVLIFAAYEFEGGTLDCYPGPQIPPLWEIEAGEFRDELPQITQFIQTRPPMLYAEIQKPPQDADRAS